MGSLYGLVGDDSNSSVSRGGLSLVLFGYLPCELIVS